MACLVLSCGSDGPESLEDQVEEICERTSTMVEGRSGDTMSVLECRLDVASQRTALIVAYPGFEATSAVLASRGRTAMTETIAFDWPISSVASGFYPDNVAVLNEIDRVLIFFDDTEETVFEISSAIIQLHLSNELTMEQVVERMTISQG
jgi:hypothetical protein